MSDFDIVTGHPEQDLPYVIFYIQQTVSEQKSFNQKMKSGELHLKESDSFL